MAGDSEMSAAAGVGFARAVAPRPGPGAVAPRPGPGARRWRRATPGWPGLTPTRSVDELDSNPNNEEA
jgi:hypothetical protein